MLLKKIVHHFAAEIGCSYAMLKYVVSGSWKHVVVRSQLVKVFEPLHSRAVDKHPAVLRQTDVPVNDVVYADLFRKAWIRRLVLGWPIL